MISVVTEAGWVKSALKGVGNAIRAYSKNKPKRKKTSLAWAKTGIFSQALQKRLPKNG